MRAGTNPNLFQQQDFDKLVPTRPTVGYSGCLSLDHNVIDPAATQEIGQGCPGWSESDDRDVCVRNCINAMILRKPEW